jgi:hypothetical protein
MQRINDEANLAQEIIDKYNSIIPLVTHNLPIYYQFRHINNILTIYSKLKINSFKIEFEKIYNTCMKFKLECIKDIRIDTHSNLDPNKIYTLPTNPSIFDEFINLIENSGCVDYSYENMNSHWVNELKDNKTIRNIVYNMLYKYYIPIQEIIPVLYKYYSYYATEEHFFLE